MTQTELDELTAQVGKRSAESVEALRVSIEKQINDKAAEVAKGKITEEAFNAFKNDVMGPLQAKLDAIDKTMIEQGVVIKSFTEAQGSVAEKTKGLEEILKESMPDIVKAYNKEIQEVRIELKAAAITSIGNTVAAQQNVPTSPYAPGIGGADLTLYDIIQNPAFITSKVSVGRTNQARLAWINELTVEGTPALVAEGTLKPLTQHTFRVEMSTAKKVAAYIVLTEEFEQDLPGLATQVQRLLQYDVLRFFDNAVQADVISTATGFVTPNPLSGAIANATLWDAIGAGMAQIASNNYIPNAIGLNPYTFWKLQMVKDNQGRYNVPPFLNLIQDMIVQAVKVYPNMVLLGDLKQYNVDIYKEFSLRIGWVNDDLIKNQFTVVGEMRYHSYISTARRVAIAYYNLATARVNITGTGS